jgi:hypothetical protein
MVPRVALPPGVELTDQATEAFVVPETEAENVRPEPTRMLAEEGETVTETDCDGGGWLLEEEEPLLQAAREKIASNTSRKKEMR